MIWFKKTCSSAYIAGALFWCSCADPAKPVAELPFETDTVSESTDSDSDTLFITDSDSEASYIPPQTIDIPYTGADPAFDQCIRVDTGFGRYPSLVAVGGRWFIFYTDADEQSPLMLVRSAPDDGVNFSAPAPFVYGARSATITSDSDHYLALGVRQYYAVLMTSVDGIDWKEQQYIAPDEPTYNCDGFAPALFASVPEGRSPELIVLGNDYNTGIFGCTPRIFLSGKNSTGWFVPKQIGQGDGYFVWQGSNTLVISDFGGLLSTDNGLSFTEIDDGDLTSQQIAGTGGAMTADRLLILNSYSWANEYRLVLLESPDEGVSWPAENVLRRTPGNILNARIASSRESIGVIWSESAGSYISLSSDGGRSFSPPADLNTLTNLLFSGEIRMAVSENSWGLLLETAAGLQFCRGTIN